MESLKDKLIKNAFSDDITIDWNSIVKADSKSNLKSDNFDSNVPDYSRRIWKVADWLSSGTDQLNKTDDSDVENDDKDFLSLITPQSNSTKSSKSHSSRYRFPKYNKFSTNNNYNRYRGQTNNTSNYTNQPKKNTVVSTHRNKTMNYNRCQYKWFLKPSIQLKETWEEVVAFDFAKISKIKNTKLPTVNDVMWCGKLNRYNTNFDSTRRNPAPLKAHESTQFSVAASEDPVIRNQVDSAEIFATDIVISTLMTCVKSLASWHIAVVKIGNFIFLDKRHESGVDLSYVCENARDPPFDMDINSPLELALEATRTHQKYLTQCTIHSDVLTMDNADPFLSQSAIENSSQSKNKSCSVAYRYRLFTLPDNSNMLVRCCHDAFTSDSVGNQDQSNAAEYVDIYTLLQWSSKLHRVDWKSKFFEQSGSILASEIKLNNNKVARWTAKALLSGTNKIKIGFISRDDLRINKSHCIVGSTTCQPENLASMIDFNYGNAWGIVYHVLDHIKSLPDGTFILAKVPLKNTLQLYRTPDSNLPSEDDVDVDVEVDESFPLGDGYEYDDILFE